MPVTIRLPGSLREAVGGETKIVATGRTLGEVLDDLERRYPGARSRVVDDRDELRTYVNVYIGDTDARATGGLAAPVPADAEIMIIPAMAGGVA